MKNPAHLIRINPAKAALALLATSLVILILALLGQREFQTGNPVEKFFLDLYAKEFFVDGVTNVITYWNLFNLTIMAALAVVIASIKIAQRERYRYEWSLLGVLFFYFAVDALAGITQKLIALLRDLPNMDVGTYYNWFYPVATIVVIVVTGFLVWFYLHLDAKNKMLFPLSLVLFLLGAFRDELFSGRVAELYGKKSPPYLLLTHAGELIELVGIILMIYLLLTYIVSHYSEIELLSQEPERKPWNKNRAVRSRQP